jgi:zinc transporter
MSQLQPIALKDHRGLLCGFLLRPQIPAQPLEWDEVLAAFSIPNSAVWLHFNLVDSRSRDWIANCDRIPEVAKDLLLAADPHIQLEVLEDGFMGTIGDLDYEFHTDPDRLGLLRIYVDRGCMISVRRTPLKAIDKLRRDLSAGESIDSPMDLMVHLVKLLNDMFDRVVTDLREVVEEMEDQILKENFYADRRELSRVRRLLAQLRRHLNANRQALATRLIPNLPSWCSENEESELRRDFDRLSAVAQDLELVQERARLVQEEMAGKLQETVNRNLYVLSIVTTIFLPITLITGIFGMNVGGVPWTQDSLGFVWCIGLMGLTLAIAFIVLRKQQFL